MIRDSLDDFKDHEILFTSDDEDATPVVFLTKRAFDEIGTYRFKKEVQCYRQCWRERSSRGPGWFFYWIDYQYDEDRHAREVYSYKGAIHTPMIARRFLIAKRFLTGEQSRAAAARRVGLSIDPKFRRSDGMRVVGPPSPPPSTVVRGGVSYGVSYYVNWNT